MTLQKAIKSGKPFKRPKHHKYLEVNEKGILGWCDPTEPWVVMGLTADSVLATDWIVETVAKVKVKKKGKKK